MNNTKSPRFLECLIGLKCQVCNNVSIYLIIDVDPETNALVLLDEGYVRPPLRIDGKAPMTAISRAFRRASVTEIWLTEKSQDELTKKTGKPYRPPGPPWRQ